MEGRWGDLLYRAELGLQFSGPQILELAHGRIALTGDVSNMGSYISEMIDISVDMGTRKLKLYITSPGGQVDEGLRIIRAMHRAQKAGVKIVGIVRGSAMSMALHIFQECDERRMGKADLLMIHGVTTAMIGDIKNLKAETKLVKFWQQYLIERLAARVAHAMPESPAAVPEFWASMAEDNTPEYFTPDEALDLGLIDAIEEDTEWIPLGG